MRSLIGLVFLLIAGHAYASCPAVSTDCPSPVFNSVTIGGNLTTGGTLTAGSLSGTLLATATPTGGSAARSIPDILADEANILGFAGVDRTGSTDSSTGIQNAITAACASPVKSVFFPPGIYKLSTNLSVTACTGLMLRAVPGTATLIADATTAASPARLLRVIRQSYLTVYGLTFDGNSTGSTASNNVLINVVGPSDHITIDSITCQNAVSSCITAGNIPGITGTLSAQATAGSNTLTFSSTPAGLQAGAYFYGSEVDPEVYVTATDATTATLSKNLTDTLLNGSTQHWTFAFTTSSDAVGGATTLPTSSTTNLSVGQAIQYSGFCIVPGTKITAVTTNTSVTIDTPLTCKVSSGSNIAAMVGVSEFTVKNSTFLNPGISQRTLGSATFTTSGSTSSAATQVVFSCVSASCSPGVGAIPGDMTAAAGMPAGMPASNLVVDGPSVNSGAGTFTVTFANPTTGTIAGGTNIPFAVGAASGNGYAIWLGQSAWFANRNITFSNNVFVHAWSSPIFINNATNLLLQGNTYREDYLEYQNTTIAPSACIAPQSTVNMRIVGDFCSGATGNGLEGDHNVGLQIEGSTFNSNGRAGIYLCGGHDIRISGTFRNNGQWVNHPTIQQYTSLTNGGIILDGSCTGTQAATISNVVIGTVNVSDDQATPTQPWGIAKGRSQGTVSNLSIGTNSVTAVGNTTGAVGLTPALSSCGGGSPALSATATDYSGTITEGTSATGCTLTFGATKAAAPVCSISSPGAAAFTSFSTSTTALTIVNSSASGNQYSYVCTF